jgi:TPR repeat protein
MCYHNGKGVEQDLSLAAKWLREAAEQDLISAQFNLGYMYAEGEGVEQDLKRAAEWYRKAAEQGNQAAKQALENLEKSR